MFDDPLDDRTIDEMCSGLTLHKFYSFSSTTIEALSEPYLWFSTIEEFNDPFEGQFQYQFNPSLEEILLYECAVGEYASKLEKEYRLNPDALIQRLRPRYINSYEQAIRPERYAYCCLFMQTPSSTEKYPRAPSRMWSLYGDGLRGLRVNFNAALLLKSLGLVRAEPIQYVETPRGADVLGYMEASSVGHGPRWTHFEFRENAQYKHVDWEYESELRIKAHCKGPLPYAAQAITSVDIGERMPLSQQKVIKHIFTSQNPSVIFNLARVKAHSFEIEIIPFGG